MISDPRVRKPTLSTMSVGEIYSSQGLWDVIGLVVVIESVPTFESIIAPLATNLTYQKKKKNFPTVLGSLVDDLSLELGP